MIGTLVSLLVLLAEPAAGPRPPPDDLLRKMAETDARLMRLYQEGAVTMTSKVEELGGDGKAKHTQEVVLRLAQKDGKPFGEVVRATRDGKDITEDERRSQEAQRAREEEAPKPKDGPGGGRGRRMDLTTPFGAEQQPRYAFTQFDPDPNHPALAKVGFAPKGKPSQELWTGIALVDPATGEVKWMKQRPSKLPTFVDRMEMILEFSAATPQGSAISVLQMDGEGGLPLFKKRFRVVTRFSDYAAK